MPVELQPGGTYQILNVGTDDAYWRIREELIGRQFRLSSDRSWTLHGGDAEQGVSGYGQIIPPHERFGEAEICFHQVMLTHADPEFKYVAPKRKERKSVIVKKVQGNMTEQSAEISIENGGGSHEAVWNIIEEVYAKFAGYTASEVRDLETIRQVEDVRSKIYAALRGIPCETFYTATGAKITRPLKRLLEEHIGKENVAPLFAEFCKQVGDLYTEVHATATLRPVYFRNDQLVGYYGDEDSCFKSGGCNASNGRFLDRSLNTGVITVTPHDDRFAQGRMIFWIVDDTHAHLLNRYNTYGRRELPVSIFVRALEVLSKTRLSYSHERSEETLPIYINRGYTQCNALEGSFQTLNYENLWFCPVCEELRPTKNFESTTRRNSFLIGCSPDCMDDLREPNYACVGCGEDLDEDDAVHYDGDAYCMGCYEDRFSPCFLCDETYHNDDLQTGRNQRGRVVYVCQSCLDDHFRFCDFCEEYQDNDTFEEAVDADEPVCRACTQNHGVRCDNCNDLYIHPDRLNDGLCPTCVETQEEEEEEIELQNTDLETEEEDDETKAQAS